MTLFSERHEQVAEIKRCASDLLYFANTYVKVHNPKEDTLFNTYPFQDECLKVFVRDHFVIVNKARQMGVTWMLAAYSAWLLLFHRDKSIGYVSHQLAGTSTNFLKRVKAIVKGVPTWMMFNKIVVDNIRTLKLSSRSRIDTICANGSACCGLAVDLLIIEEAAFIPRLDEFWIGAFPCLSMGGRAIITSTQNKRGDHFDKMWRSAIWGQSNFVPILLPWYLHPERGPGWLEEEVSRYHTPERIASEYLCEPVDVPIRVFQ